MSQTDYITSYDKAVADSVLNAIEADGISLRSVADGSGIAYATLYRKLKLNGAPLDISELKRLADLLGRKVSAFLPDARRTKAVA